MNFALFLISFNPQTTGDHEMRDIYLNSLFICSHILKIKIQLETMKYLCNMEIW